jgi:hypothetical protein
MQRSPSTSSSCPRSMLHRYVVLQLYCDAAMCIGYFEQVQLKIAFTRQEPCPRVVLCPCTGWRRIKEGGGVTSMCFQRSHSLLISQHLCSQGAHCAAEKHAQLMFERYQLASEHIRATEAEMAGLLDQLHAAKVRMQLYILCTATLVVANAPTSNSQLQCTDLHTNQLIAHWFKPACGMHNIWPRAQPQQSCGAQWALLVLDLPCAHKLLFLVLSDCCVYVLLQSGCSDAEMKPAWPQTACRSWS